MMMNVFWMFLILDAWFRYISCAILLQFSFIATMSLQKGNLDWFDKWDLGKITAAHRAEHFLSLSLNFEVIWHSQSFAFCAVCSCSAMTCRASELQKLNHKRSPRLAQLTGRRSKRAIWRSSSVDGKSWKRQARTVQYCAPSNVEHAKLVLSFYIILIQWKNLPRLCSSTCNKSQTIW
jgi:hypothetical protein